jgi:hypothetical protein
MAQEDVVARVHAKKAFSSPVTDEQLVPIRVITFNTAVGNPRIKTDQRDFLELPFYREIIEGCPGAAILAAQEVGPEQAKALKRAAGGGHLRVIHIQRPGQGNALLVPARFEVLSHRSRYFVWSQLAALAMAAAAEPRDGSRPARRARARPSGPTASARPTGGDSRPRGEAGHR